MVLLNLSSWGRAVILALVLALANSSQEDQHQHELLSRQQLQSIQEPVNMPSPAPISQEDARQLAQYFMMQSPPTHLNQESHQLNLANMNDRTMIKNQPQVPLDYQVSLVRSTPHNNHNNNINNNRRQSQQQQVYPKNQLLVPNSSQSKRSDHLRMVPLDQQQVHHHNYAAEGFKKLIHGGPLEPLKQTCITRATPYLAKCEDHLIKRLNQDATEGRTVIDVSRRVCCALFWHKQCIRDKVVELCPDSNPVAADLLTGSRNQDLTLSCQRFNQDGCNTSHVGASPEHWLIATSMFIFVLWLLQ